MKGRLVRYAPSQLLDYFIERGAVTFAMGALFGSLMVMTNSARSDAWWEGGTGLLLIQGSLATLLGLFAWFGTLTAVNGVISNDRERGTFRFLFSKPIRVLAYYAQAWLVNGIGLLIVVTALLALFALAVRPFFPPGIFLYVALTYVLLGGIGFLLSSITKRDGTLLVAFWLLTLVLRAEYAADRGFAARVVRVLTPPADGMSTMVFDALAGNIANHAGTVYSALAYGVACFVLGLVVLRLRPMAT